MSHITEQDIAAIKKLMDKSVQFGLDGEWDKYLTLYTDDAVVMPTDQPSVEGKDAARSFLAKWPPIREYSTLIVDTEGCDNFACARGTFTETVEPEPGKRLSMKGKWLGRYRKQQDGSWLCATLIWNLDEPLSAG